MFGQWTFSPPVGLSAELAQQACLHALSPSNSSNELPCNLLRLSHAIIVHSALPRAVCGALFAHVADEVGRVGPSTAVWHRRLLVNWQKRNGGRGTDSPYQFDSENCCPEPESGRLCASR